MKQLMPHCCETWSNTSAACLVDEALHGKTGTAQGMEHAPSSVLCCASAPCAALDVVATLSPGHSVVCTDTPAGLQYALSCLSAYLQVVSGSRSKLSLPHRVRADHNLCGCVLI